MVKDVVKRVADQKNDPSLHGAPFWAWNGKLEKDELVRQINVMKEMGLGGFHMHVRSGLDIQLILYLYAVLASDPTRYAIGGAQYLYATNDKVTESVENAFKSFMAYS